MVSLCPWVVWDKYCSTSLWNSWGDKWIPLRKQNKTNKKKKREGGREVRSRTIKQCHEWDHWSRFSLDFQTKNFCDCSQTFHPISISQVYPCLASYWQMKENTKLFHTMEEAADRYLSLWSFVASPWLLLQLQKREWHVPLLSAHLSLHLEVQKYNFLN